MSIVQYRRKTSFTLLSVCLAASICSTTIRADKAAGPDHPRYAPDSILVKPRPGAAIAAMAQLHAPLHAQAIRTFPGIGNLQVIKLPPGLTVERALAHYRNNPLVAYAEPDYQLQVFATPNDPSFSQLWGLNNTGQTGGTADADIDATEAWNVRTSAGNLVVAVIDTGIRYTHTDLTANMWINPGEIAGNGIDDDANGVVDDVHGINALAGTGDPLDDNGHGTHVAGTIGAVGNNGTGVAGVAWSVKLMACKFLDAQGTGSLSDAVTCIDYARQNGARIMNNSWGGGGFSQALADAIAAARNDGILFVVAAGNSGMNNDSTPAYPSSYNLANIVSVAATDHNDQRAYFSNYGTSSVHLGAPGVNIVSTYNTSDTGYASLSGTSMACPHVAGAAALVWAQFPTLSHTQVKARLLAASDSLATMANIVETGGRLNLHRALTENPVANFKLSVLSGEPPLTVTLEDQSVGNISSRQVSFGDGTTETLSDGVVTASHIYNTLGTYTVTLIVNGPSGSSTKSRVVSVANNYRISSVAPAWIDTTGMTALTMTDDSVSAAIGLPFAFTYYEQPQSTLYISSNGLILFGSALGGTTWLNHDMPNVVTPNNIVCPYWDDLNPGIGGSIRHGVAGVAPNRVCVVSWENVPKFGDANTTLTFQVQLHENNNLIEFHYGDIKQSTLNGGGSSATVGVERDDGVIARKLLHNAPALSNNTAYRFAYNSSAPNPCTVACPANIDVNAATGQCGATVQTQTPTLTGDCGAVQCTTPTGSFFPVGVTPVTCVTTSGHQCGFTVTVHDIHPPVISACPPPIATNTAAGQCARVVTYSTPTATDNCAVSSVVCSPPSGASFSKGTTTVTCTANDSSNNTRTCQFTVTVTDAELPVISCPPAKTVTATSANGATVTYAAPIATDNCPGVNAACVPASGSFFPVGATAVTCTATDSSNNTRTCQFTVTVENLVCTPGVITGLQTTATVNPPSVTLTWNADNCATGYVIKRKTGRKKPSGGYTIIAELPAGQTSFTDTSVVTDRCYQYRIRATNSATWSDPIDACTK
jgi:subtilisin family serine protease